MVAGWNTYGYVGGNPTGNSDPSGQAAEGIDEESINDEQGHLIGTYDASAVPLDELVYLEDRPVADVRNGTVYRILTDPLQTPRKVLDSTGTVVWFWDGKEAFGASVPTGTLTFNLRFPGQYADVETGLVNNGCRGYAPVWVLWWRGIDDALFQPRSLGSVTVQFNF